MSKWKPEVPGVTRAEQLQPAVDLYKELGGKYVVGQDYELPAGMEIITDIQLPDEPYHNSVRVTLKHPVPVTIESADYTYYSAQILPLEGAKVSEAITVIFQGKDVVIERVYLSIPRKMGRK